MDDQPSAPVEPGQPAVDPGKVIAGVIALAAGYLTIFLLQRAFHLTSHSSLLWGVPVVVVTIGVFIAVTRIRSRTP